MVGRRDVDLAGNRRYGGGPAVGIAIGAGSDVAVETADVILVRSNPLDVVAINARMLKLHSPDIELPESERQ